MARVLFVCVHNAGRSQMAEALFRARNQELGSEHKATSAGTLGAGEINPVCVEALSEIGVSVKGQYPKVLDPGLVEAADIIVSMGCGVDAEACPTRFLVTEDWGLDDPKGQPIEVVRVIRDLIREKVDDLLGRLSG